MVKIPVTFRNSSAKLFGKFYVLQKRSTGY